MYFCDQMIERWLPIVGYEGFYEVSDWGRVRSLRYLGHSWNRLRDPPKILQPTPNVKSGHLWVTLSNGLDRGKRTVHTLVLDAFIGPRPTGKEGCHEDGKAANNRLENLRWDTKSANTLDAYRHGSRKNAFHHCGESHPLAKLTEESVRCIRAEPSFSGVNGMLSRAFGITSAAIGNIRAGRTWEHVKQ